jgi:hypothetical protein
LKEATRKRMEFWHTKLERKIGKMEKIVKIKKTA